MEQLISIHAPTRGATACCHEQAPLRTISIHAPTRGATLFYDLQPFAGPLFQSTLPREERHALAILKGLIFDFNPRSHERSDNSNIIYSIIASISIHAPTRGATIKAVKSGDITTISIHAPTRGATGTCYMSDIEIYISIHAPTRGATISRCRLACIV